MKLKPAPLLHCQHEIQAQGQFLNQALNKSESWALLALPDLPAQEAGMKGGGFATKKMLSTSFNWKLGDLGQVTSVLILSSLVCKM